MNISLSGSFLKLKLILVTNISRYPSIISTHASPSLFIPQHIYNPLSVSSHRTRLPSFPSSSLLHFIYSITFPFLSSPNPTTRPYSVSLLTTFLLTLHRTAPHSTKTFYPQLISRKEKKYTNIIGINESK